MYFRRQIFQKRIRVLRASFHRKRGSQKIPKVRNRMGRLCRRVRLLRSHMIQKRWFRRMKAKAVTVWTFRLNCLEVRKTLMEMEAHRLGQLLKIQEKP